MATPHLNHLINTTKNAILTLTFSSAVGAYAGDTTGVIAYQMMSEEKEIKKTYLWNGPVDSQVSPTTKNWNLPKEAIGAWGVGNRSDGGEHKVVPYSITDPGFSGPNGESYGIEIEFGNNSIPSRSSDSKNVKFYTDFGQTGITTSGVDRAEVHIRSTLKSMDVKEGETLWIGWSEYYSHVDTARTSTVLQFRNQPSKKVLKNNGFTADEIDALIAEEVHVSGPASAIETKPIDGNLHHHFSIRQGTPTTWNDNERRTHTMDTPIIIGQWYDFIVKMKYAQNDDGYFHVWVYESNKQQNYSVKDDPEWKHNGSTMYTYPSGYRLPIAAPEIRFGVYRYGAKKADNITDNDRYMIKYAGPLRLWVGASEEGFDHVKPR